MLLAEAASMRKLLMWSEAVREEVTRLLHAQSMLS